MGSLSRKFVGFLGLFSLACVAIPAYGAISQCPTPDPRALYELLREASPHDARLLLNLLYWSYQRSHSTLYTQDAAEKNLHEQWIAWQSCADRRLNPKAVAAPLRGHVHHAVFEQAQKEFHRIQTCYADIVELATHARYYTHHPVVDFITTLREEARCMMRHIVKQRLAVMAKELEQKLLVQSLALRSDTKGIVSYLINQVAVASFVQLDASWRLSSDKLMLQFLIIQELFNSVWTAIETSRELLYKTYFHAVYNVMCELRFPAVSFTNLVRHSSDMEHDAYVLSIP